MSRVDASLMARAFGLKSKLRSIVPDHLLNADLKEQVQRPSQVQPALGGPDVGAIGQPDPIGRAGREVAPEQVRRYRDTCALFGSAAGRQPHAAHKARDPLAADPPAIGAEPACKRGLP
jgi:hypothetical protein